MREFYTVQPGDSLWSIAAAKLGSGTRWKEIAAANDLSGRTMILAGERLVVPLSAPPAWGPSFAGAAALPSNACVDERAGAAIPARAFLFVLADEIDPTRRKVVRKVMVSQAMADEFFSRSGKRLGVLPNPERFGIRPGAPGSAMPPGRHVMGIKPSPFTSASNAPLGASRFAGQRFWIDVDKARGAGATIHELDEIIADLDRIAAKARTPTEAGIAAKARNWARMDSEVLIRGEIPASAIKGSGAMAMTRALQGVQIVGVAVSVYDIGTAAQTSFEQGSARPLGAEVVRQTGGWAAAWAGMKLGGTVGTMLGIETGPGAIATGAIGGLIGGFGGYFGFDFIADYIHEN